MEIRTFVESDREELLDLFSRAGADSPSGSLWGHAASEADIYLTPYMDRVPGSLFLAVVEDRLIGYLAGCPDASLLPSENDRIASAIRDHRLLFRLGPLRFFARSAWDMARARLRRQPTAGELDDPRWPAHLHINVIPEARGAGAAPALMEAYLNQLRSTGVPGCYLQTLVENRRAVRFFERMGFEPYGEAALVPGVRFEGAPVHQLTMVWSP